TTYSYGAASASRHARLADFQAFGVPCRGRSSGPGRESFGVVAVQDVGLGPMPYGTVGRGLDVEPVVVDEGAAEHRTEGHEQRDDDRDREDGNGGMGSCV